MKKRRSNTTEELETVKSSYIGQTSMTFKKRFYGHNKSMRDKNVNQTGLSRKVWKLREDGVEFDLKWSIIDEAPSFNGISCKLCLSETCHILFNSDQNTLNKKTELMSACRHKARWRIKKPEPKNATLKMEPD